jgi:hypothetical protein
VAKGVKNRQLKNGSRGENEKGTTRFRRLEEELRIQDLESRMKIGTEASGIGSSADADGSVENR